MKKLIFLLTAITILGGCAAKNDPMPVETEEVEEAAEAEEEAVVIESKPSIIDKRIELSKKYEYPSGTKWEDIMPDPYAYFTVEEDALVDEDSFGMELYGLKMYDCIEYDYEGYVDALKKLGFTDVVYDVESDNAIKFKASREDYKYFVELEISKYSEDSIIYVNVFFNQYWKMLE